MDQLQLPPPASESPQAAGALLAPQGVVEGDEGEAGGMSPADYATTSV
jgi:hypothetical protein